MKNFFYKIFQKSNYKIININFIILFFLIILKLLFIFLGYEIEYYIFQKYIYLSSSLKNLLYRPWTILTYSFIHEGFINIIFNMLILNFFVKIISKSINNKKIIILYILGNISGGLFFIILYNMGHGFLKINSEAIGAAGGVYSIIIITTFLAPKFKILNIEIKYITFIVFTFFIITNNIENNFTQIGGSVMGYIYINQLKKGKDITKLFIKIINTFHSKDKIKIIYKN